MISVRPPAEQLLHRLLDQSLRLVVEARRRFVEHDDGGILEEDAGERDALALSAGELDPALADERRHPVGQTLDELQRVRGARGGDHLVVRRVRVVRRRCCRESSR